jgi:hypothetical protein
MRRRVSIGVCLLCATLGVAACGSGSANHSPEYDLAVIDGRAPVDESDPVLAQYRRPLATVAHACSISTEKVGNYVAGTQGLLEKDGFVYSQIEVLQAAATFAPAGAGNFTCAQMFALWAAATEGSQ